jgi:imidazolonepropionase
LQHGLSLDEALAAATTGGARALGLDSETDATGMLRAGGFADLQMLEAPSVTHIPYRPGVPLTRATWRRGIRSL